MADKEKPQNFPLRLPPPLHRLLRLISVERKESLNDIIVKVMTAWVQQQPEADRFKEAPTQEG